MFFIVDERLFKEYVDNGTIQGGMIPKIENSLAAVKAGVKQVIITQASDIAADSGTVIKL